MEIDLPITRGKMKKNIKNTKTKRQEPKRRKKSYKDYFGKK